MSDTVKIVERCLVKRHVSSLTPASHTIWIGSIFLQCPSINQQQETSLKDGCETGLFFLSHVVCIVHSFLLAATWRRFAAFGGTMVNQLVRIDMGHPWSSGHPNQNPKHGLPQHIVHSQTTGYNCLLKNITKGHWFSWTSTLLARSSHHTVMVMAINILPSDYVIWKSYIAKGS